MKKRWRVLTLFISIFLRNRSLSDARWFYGKKRKIGKENLYLTENRLSWNEMCCASDNHNYNVSHMCKRIFKFEQLLTKYQIFTILPQISHFYKNRNFSGISNFLDQLFHPYKFFGRDMSGILFFIFASCEPLSFLLSWLKYVSTVTEFELTYKNVYCIIYALVKKFQPIWFCLSWFNIETIRIKFQRNIPMWHIALTTSFQINSKNYFSKVFTQPGR